MFEDRSAPHAYAVTGSASFRNGLALLQHGPGRVADHVLITVRPGLVELTAVDPETGLWWEVIALPARQSRVPRDDAVSFPAPIHELDYRARGMGLPGEPGDAVEIELTAKEMRLNRWSVDRADHEIEPAPRSRFPRVLPVVDLPLEGGLMGSPAGPIVVPAPVADRFAFREIHTAQISSNDERWCLSGMTAASVPLVVVGLVHPA